MTVYQDWDKIGAERPVTEADLWELGAGGDHQHGFYHKHGKRVLDVALALLLLVLLSLPMLVVAGLLLITQGRPLIYAGRRMRAPGQPFRQYKFRTMILVDRDRGATGAHKHWRITRLGRFLRRTRMDELPQLFNILSGDMSFVGPRPPLPEYVARFPALYARVLQRRPGVTGLATMIYHRHEDRIMAQCDTAEETDRAYYARCLPTKLRIDLIYLRTCAPGLDFWIMWKTVLAVIPGFDRPRRKRRASPAQAPDRQPPLKTGLPVAHRFERPEQHQNVQQKPVADQPDRHRLGKDEQRDGRPNRQHPRKPEAEHHRQHIRDRVDDTIPEIIE